MIIVKFFLMPIFISVGRTAIGVRSPSKQMMIEGYDVHSVRIAMYLVNKGIQYIPDGTFSDFPNITVSLCDLVIPMVAWLIPTNADMSDADHTNTYERDSELLSRSSYRVA